MREKQKRVTSEYCTSDVLINENDEAFKYSAYG